MTPHDHLLAHAALPHAGMLLDAPSLSALLGREVELVHRRLKPGHNVLVAWRCRDTGEYGWAEATSSPDKVRNTLRRAGRVGEPVTVHREGAVSVLSGALWSDRKLVRALRGLPRTGLRILRYNPHRRLVAATPDGLVVRIHATGAEHLVGTSARWQAAGIRSLDTVGGGRSAVSPWWGRGDLRTVADPAASRTVGAEIARLHALPVPGGRMVELPDIDTTAAALAPWAAERVHSVARRLRVLLPEATSARVCELHGDLSPEQVLVGASAGEIRIIDLDRATTGPAARDVGNFLAACRQDGQEDLGAEFLAGYRAAGGEVTDGQLGVWESLAHLHYALAPLRRGAEDWAAGLSRSLTLAEQALDLAPPSTVDLDGESWTVKRAWPGDRRGLVLELSHPGTGEIRAGLWSRGTGQVDAPGTDPKLHLPEGTLVSHRRGKRAVVRSADGRRYTKVVRAGKAAAILRGVERAAPFAAAFRMPEVLGADEASVTLAALPGRSLHDPSVFTPDEWARAWREVARGLNRVQVAATPPDLPVHGAAEECAVLETWMHRSLMYVDDPAALREVIAGACAALRALPEPPLAPSHRDLHSKQLVWSSEGGPGVLDVDTACRADPALDVGNLRAHAVWRRRQGVWDRAQTDAVLSALEECAVDPVAVAGYHRATLARLVCVYAARPRYRDAAMALLADLSEVAGEPLAGYYW